MKNIQGTKENLELFDSNKVKVHYSRRDSDGLSSDVVRWTMRDGNSINVDDMDIQHLRNTLKMIIKNKSKVNISKHKIEIHGEIAQDMIDQGYLQDQEDWDPRDDFNFLK